MDDMTVITADEAAQRVRQSGLLNDAHPMSAEDRHRANFVGRVCEHLGLDPTVENFARVAAALRELKIEPHAGHEYPKYVKTGKKVKVWDGASGDWIDGKEDEQVIVHDADEEAKATSGEPVDAHDGHPAGSGPEPHTDKPTAGLTPTRPEGEQADAPTDGGYRNAGAGKLDETAKPPVPSKPPQAPKRAS